MDESGQTHHLLDLVALQMADEVQRGPLVGALGLLFQHLLHPVLAAEVHPGGNGLTHPVSVVHLGGGQQQDLLWIPPGGERRPVHVFAHKGDIFGNGHRRKTFFL